MVSRTDPGSATQRTNFGLPNIAASQVTIVSDTTTCRIASQAYDLELGASAASEPPIVLQLADKYLVVKRLAYRRGRISILFNQNFTTVIKRIWF
jgi:CRP-like cAMP-binding protein